MSVDAADEHFASWMYDNLEAAARHFGLTVTGAPVFGWRLRSIGARAEGSQGVRWLRVVSQEPEWAQGEHWTGTLDANAITGVPKPRVLDVHEWREGRIQRAEVMTLMPGAPCSPTDALQSDPDLTAEWWSQLRRSTDVLAAAGTERRNADQAKVSQRITERFGDNVDTTVAEWETVHGDLHWSNLLGPDFALLDWELWGRGPAGTDAATLLCYSLLVPAVADRVRALFADKLDSTPGRVAQMFVVARLLRRADGGDHPELREPLERHSAQLITYG